MDLGDPNIVYDLNHRLLAQFGASVPGELDGPDTHLDTGVTMFADRYGGTFGHSHGGSGRAGTAGLFNAKGVGATPLRDPNANWYHSHGCMWLEEAIREAIFSEVCLHAFPWQANPIVAIIDTGEDLRYPNGELGARRAIAVRPAALRVSHLERNILFGTAGTPDSDQFQDFMRVDEVVSYIRANGVDASILDEGDILTVIVARICRQIGFGRAHRLFHGDFLSSNICVSGALIDFGAFRGVMDWRKRTWEENGLPFGGEDRRLFQTARSLSFHLRKHGDKSCGNSLMPMDHITTTIHDEFATALKGICDPHANARSVAARLEEFYHFEQAEAVSEVSDWPSLIAGIKGQNCERPDHIPYRLGSAIRSDLTEKCNDHERQVAENKLLRWAAPFNCATREAVLWRTVEAINGAGMPPCPRHISEFIAININGIRRSFLDTSVDELILQQRTLSGVLLLTCSNARTGRSYWRVEGPATGEALLVDGKPLSPWPGCRFYEAGSGSIGLISESDPTFRLRQAGQA